MIIGIGTDLVYIPRIAETYENQGEKFLNRCFGIPEIEYILSTTNEDIRINRMAKRWAAKEAFAKALGTGISQFAHLKDICIVADAMGKPEIMVYNQAKETLKRMVKTMETPKIHLSLSDEQEFAQAFVVLSVEKD